jgi:hypothetical protein
MLTRPEVRAPVSPEALETFKASGDEIIHAVAIRTLVQTDLVTSHADQAERMPTSSVCYATTTLQTAIFPHNPAVSELGPGLLSRKGEHVKRFKEN